MRYQLDTKVGVLIYISLEFLYKLKIQGTDQAKDKMWEP